MAVAAVVAAVWQLELEAPAAMAAVVAAAVAAWRRPSVAL